MHARKWYKCKWFQNVRLGVPGELAILRLPVDRPLGLVELTKALDAGKNWKWFQFGLEGNRRIDDTYSLGQVVEKIDPATGVKVRKSVIFWIWVVWTYEPTRTGDDAEGGNLDSLHGGNQGGNRQGVWSTAW